MQLLLTLPASPRSSRSSRLGPMAGQADVGSGARLATDTAFPREQETSASDSHVGLSVAMGWEAGAGGPSMGGDKVTFRSLVGSMLGNLTMRASRGGQARQGEKAQGQAEPRLLGPS